MIVRRSSKLHAELDMSAAARAFAEYAAAEDLSGEQITSAWDLYCVETLRDRHSLRIGEAFPTDVFVFGKGEPDDPSCTKVGGRPFWPIEQEWPRARDGSPCHFLAQFNFADSVDVIGAKLPGMVLLLLTDSEEDWLWRDDGISFHWVSLDITPASNLNVPSAVGSSGPFYGAIYRSADYPDAHKVAYGLDVSQSYELPILNGTKIGGLPHWIQGGEDMAGEFLCQLGSIQAAPNVPYPWVNRCEPLDLDSDGEGIHGKDNCAVFGDMGSIFLFLDGNGKVSYLFECY